MSNKSLQKSEIVYDRLYKEYRNWESISDFMKEFDQSRQSFYDRKKAKRLPYDELKRVFTDINEDWLHSDNEPDLKMLPVNKK